MVNNNDGFVCQKMSNTVFRAVFVYIHRKGKHRIENKILFDLTYQTVENCLIMDTQVVYQLIPIKEEMLEPPSDINIEMIKTEPIDGNILQNSKQNRTINVFL